MKASLPIHRSATESSLQAMISANENLDDRSELASEFAVQVVPTLVLVIGLILLASVMVLAPLFAVKDWAASGRTLSLIAVQFPVSVDRRYGISVSVRNEYNHDQSAILFYQFLQGALLLEPYRENTLTLKGIASDGFCIISWQLQSDSTEHSLLYEGRLEFENTFTVTPEETGRFLLALHRDCTDDASVLVRTTVEFPVWVKYVRRPLMSLSDQDRDEFEEAMDTLWKTSTLAGQQQYGPDYRGMDYFANILNQIEGSTGHADGNVQGLAGSDDYALLSAYLEQSLQLINPRVALPYVDLQQLCSLCVPAAKATIAPGSLRSRRDDPSRSTTVPCTTLQTFISGASSIIPLLANMGRNVSRAFRRRKDASSSVHSAAGGNAFSLEPMASPSNARQVAVIPLQDPLLWILLGSMQHLRHSQLFAPAAQETQPTATARSASQDHDAADLAGDATKMWLQGLQFEDRAVRAEELTAAQLQEVLDPAGALYRDYLRFVYESASTAAQTTDVVSR
jgi:hypothetical protein